MRGRPFAPNKAMLGGNSLEDGMKRSDEKE